MKKNNINFASEIVIIIWRFCEAPTRLKKVLIPATLVLIFIAGVLMGTHNSSSQSYAFTSKCTLSIISGTVDVTIPGTNYTQLGVDGMTLDAGNRVKTGPDSTALLTFFDGSTLKLEPSTDIEIEELEFNKGQHTITITLKQWAGETWSHVVKMVDQGSHYEIRTPSAVALVRGTRFLTKVDEAGATQVLTTEGLVSVSAQGEEIFLPVGRQTTVEPGTPPLEPKKVDISEYIHPQDQVEKGNSGNILLTSKYPNNSSNDLPDKGQHLGNGRASAQYVKNNQNESGHQGNNKASSQAVGTSQNENNGKPGVIKNQKKADIQSKKPPSGQPASSPGHSNEPSGQLASPPCHSNEPSGQPASPPGHSNEPSGQLASPPGHSNEPSGQPASPPGHSNEPSGQPASLPSHSNEPSRHGTNPHDQSNYPPGPWD